MLAAHLRGFLLPRHQYGLRSVFAENLILEGFMALEEKDQFELSMQRDSALMTNFDQDSKNATMRRLAAQTKRAAELSFMDLYRYGSSRGAAVDGIPLTKLFQIMRREGMMRELTDSEWEKIRETGKPIL